MISNKRLLLAIVIAAAGVIFQVGLQHFMRPYAYDGMYFQDWSSETLMQSVPIQALHDEPLQSVLNIHVDPPAFDALRAILVRMVVHQEIHSALRWVDARLYDLWAVLYGLLGAVLFLWLSEWMPSGLAVPAVAIFLVGPAALAYATLLDTTLPTAVLILCLYYLLWKIKHDAHGLVGMFTACVLALFFTRSMFQWLFIPVLGVCLALLGVSRPRLLRFLLIAGGIAGLYVAKQYFQFGILSTSSLSGINLTRSLSILQSHLPDSLDTSDSPGLPAVLQARRKLTGPLNFNNANYLSLDRRLTGRYLEYLQTAPPRVLADAYLYNLQQYFAPWRSYEGNVIVDRLPWRPAYDAAFASPTLPALLLIAGAAWAVRVVRRGSFGSAAALLVPGILILLISVLFERGENFRLRFFLEPVFYVFILEEIYRAARHVKQALASRRIEQPAG